MKSFLKWYFNVWNTKGLPLSIHASRHNNHFVNAEAMTTASLLLLGWQQLRDVISCKMHIDFTDVKCEKIYTSLSVAYCVCEMPFKNICHDYFLRTRWPEWAGVWYTSPTWKARSDWSWIFPSPHQLESDNTPVVWVG